jgi:hypothetical protein
MGNYMWEWKGSTSQKYTTEFLRNTPDPFDNSIVDTAKYTVISIITSKLVDGFTAKGINASVSKIDCQSNIRVVTADYVWNGIQMTHWDHYLDIDAKVYFSTDKEIMPGQLDPVTGALIAVVIEYIIVGLVAAYAIERISNWLKSMTTTTTTTTKYDPVTGKVTETTTTTSSDYGGILSLAAGAGILIAVGVGAYFILRESKSNARRKR